MKTTIIHEGPCLWYVASENGTQYGFFTCPMAAKAFACYLDPDYAPSWRSGLSEGWRPPRWRTQVGVSLRDAAGDNP